MSRIPDNVRQQVRERAHGRCEYCQKPEQYSPYTFHVDHILPVKRHQGSDEPDNLAWACFDCNSNKSGEISGYENGNLSPDAVGELQSSPPNPLSIAWQRGRKAGAAALKNRFANSTSPLFNPRTMNWRDHFDWDGPLVVGKTAIGRITLWLLNINIPERVETRRELIEAGNW